jgi:hypothetical protein
MNKILTKEQILSAYATTNIKKDLIKLLNTSRYYFEKHLNMFNLELKFCNSSPYSIEFWLNRGYSVDDANYEISIRRSYNRNYWVHKYGEIVGDAKYYEFITKGTIGKKHSVETRKKNSITLDYWIAQGYSINDAIELQKNRQKTFTLDKCIKKYGIDDGLGVFLKRQAKWQETIKSKSFTELKSINEKKDSCSVNHFKKKYGDNWTSYFIDANFTKETEIKSIVERCIEYSNLDNVIDNIVTICPKYRNLFRLLNSKIFKGMYDVNNDMIDDIHSKMIVKYNITDYKRHRYGVRITYNGITYKSHGEYKIAKYLTNSDIKFIYNGYYETSKYKYDFYIEPINLYVEYTGMSGVASYDNRLRTKLKFGEMLGMNILASNDINYIINEISLRSNEKN